jgi:N-acetyl-anhydromuramyl-L-alanine amidase AmpD
VRYPDATWRPTDKHGYGDFDTHSQKGVVIHSAEGSFAGAMSVLDGPREASWHFFVTKTGKVYQHVDTDHIAWTNGSYDANKLWWGIECEGREGEPLTELQYQALVRVVRWLWTTHQVGAAVRQETLWEHREMTRFGSPSTSCPSGRIPWAALIKEMEDDMALSAEDKEFILAQTKFLETRQNQHADVRKTEHAALQARIDALQVSGGVDIAALVKAVADELALRMKE